MTAYVWQKTRSAAPPDAPAGAATTLGTSWIREPWHGAPPAHGRETFTAATLTAAASTQDDEEALYTARREEMLSVAQTAE